MHVKVDEKNQYLNSYNETANLNAKVTEALEIVKAYIIVEAGQTVDTTLYFILQEENTDTSYVKHEEQVLTFPLSEGQRLYKDSYLADNGIHHKRKQVVLTGNENVGLNGENEEYCSFTIKDYTSVIDTSNNVNIMCNMLVANTSYNTNTIRIASSGNIIMSLNKDFCEYSTTGLKTKLKELYDAGTPMIIEIPLIEEETESYTSEQQTAYNEIQKATSYKNVTHIFSTDKTSAVFDVTYKKDLETLFNNINSALVEGGI